MKFIPRELSGVWLIEPELISDERGSFARTWCAREFQERGLNPQLTQCNLSTNRRRGTVRGMHYQRLPNAEAKLIRCTQGAIYDVIVDIRLSSPTFLRWSAYELTAANRVSLYVPEGCAHGFQTLSDETEVVYQMSEPYHAQSAAGCRWDDPAIRVHWPLPISVISEKDQAWPDFDIRQ